MPNTEETNCPECGCIFGVPNGFLKNRVADNRDFFCPNGHVMSYCDNLLDKVRRERDQLKQQIARVEQERAEAVAAERGLRVKAERKLKRVSKGVCPCCTRSFANLARHMATKHPDETKLACVAVSAA